MAIRKRGEARADDGDQDMRLQALRRFVIRSGLEGLHAGRTHALFGRWTRGRGAILMFHHVRPAAGDAFRPNSHLEITPEFLERVIRRVRERGMDIVDLDEAVARLAAPDVSRRFIVLTFDDGYRNNLVHAYPVLKREQAPFTIYVTTGFVDGTAMPWWDVAAAIVGRNRAIQVAVGGGTIERRVAGVTEKQRALDALIAALIRVPEDEQRRAVVAAAVAHGVDIAALVRESMMSWDEIRRLAADPLATIGAHTIGHHALSRLDGARARVEMAASAERIAAMTGIRPRHFAYPYGSPDTVGPRDVALARALGFATAVTTRRGVLTPAHAGRLHELPRISVNGDYQQLRILDLLLSGVPYAIERRINRIRGRAPASASSG